MFPMRAFAENIRERADALGLSSAEVARRAGLSERRYGNYVTGRREPDLGTLRRIAAVLSTSVDALLNDDGSKNPDEVRARDRLIAAVAALGEDDVVLLAVQAEAIANYRSRS